MHGSALRSRGTIAAARRLARMTQKALADAAGVSSSMVRALERGARMPGTTFSMRSPRP
ncbi:helix-turn-helix transcriptional regulator [Streptomyces sp. 891-h]|nr:helix-turn-helix transcriptional regulator [Streptomyces sp. 891-h]